jgi:hypothetical protein
LQGASTPDLPQNDHEGFAYEALCYGTKYIAP